MAAGRTPCLHDSLAAASTVAERCLVPDVCFGLSTGGPAALGGGEGPSSLPVLAVAGVEGAREELARALLLHPGSLALYRSL